MVFWWDGTEGQTLNASCSASRPKRCPSRAPWALERTPSDARRRGPAPGRSTDLGDRRDRRDPAQGRPRRRSAAAAAGRRAWSRLTHPARWGSTSLDKLRQAARSAGFDDPSSCPSRSRPRSIPPPNAGRSDSTSAVTTLLRNVRHCGACDRTAGSFAVVGAPGGNEDLGGEDFDDRRYRHLGQAARSDQWTQLKESCERSWSQSNRRPLQEARRAEEILSRAPMMRSTCRRRSIATCASPLISSTG